jgi:hypothetical protein
VFRYKLHWPDGDDAGEAAYAVYIQPGDEILTTDEGRFVGCAWSNSWCSRRTARTRGLLMVEAA